MLVKFMMVMKIWSKTGATQVCDGESLEDKTGASQVLGFKSLDICDIAEIRMKVNLALVRFVMVKV